MVQSPAFAALSALLLLAGAVPLTPQSPAREIPPGEGVICYWAIASLVAEVGSRCAPDRYPEAQAALRQSVAQTDAYVRANSNMTEDQIAAFKREQALVGASQDQICSGDAMQMFEAMASRQAAEEIRRQSDTLLARPGNPTWGTCL